MSIQIHYSQNQLCYKKPATTSRGSYTHRDFIVLEMFDTERPGLIAYGECSYLPDLSCDVCEHYEKIIQQTIDDYVVNQRLDYELLRDYPSILMGFETLIQHYHVQSYALSNTPFSKGKEGIPINGLVWMSDFETMSQQIEAKLEAGFKCIKIKIGAIDFEKEIALLDQIRARYSKEIIQIRVDANGAFQLNEAFEKLTRLSQYDLHSIEQPIKQHQWQKMGELCEKSPIPIALDEELIGVNKYNDKQELLDAIKPQFIVLKPSLHGGFYGCREWIELAEQRSIGWWITSALETNIGLNAIAHFTAELVSERDMEYSQLMHQGLGTGQLFVDNIDTPLLIKGEKLYYDVSKETKHVKLVDEVNTFWNNWYQDTLSVFTSGSTGKPKKYILKKDQMLLSASRTIKALNLPMNAHYFLCLPTQYIAGQMVLVRALYSHSKVYIGEANTQVLKQFLLFNPKNEKIDFLAITPLMLISILNDPQQKEYLSRIDTVLVGGGALSKEIEDELQQFSNAFWASYGMTETLSNIALRRLNGSNRSEYFSPLSGVELSIDSQNCLFIKDKVTQVDGIQTFDFVELLEDGRFKIKGRMNNVVNSGGIKLQPEVIESKLVDIVEYPFVISSLPDKSLGEKLVIVTQKPIDLSICNGLSKFERPKENRVVECIPMTETGKVERLKVKKLIMNQF